MAAVKDARQTS